MSVYLSNRDGNGKTNEEGHYRLQTKIISGQVLGSTALKVTETAPLSLGVLVTPGDYRIETTGGWAYTGWIDANETLTIPTADPANPRISTIIAYVDKGAATSAVPPNNPGITKLAVVNGTAAGTPLPPTGSVLQAAAGSGNPYIALADVLVGAAATQVTNSNITDRRVQITLAPSVLNNSGIGAIIGNFMYPIGSLYFNANVDTNPGTLLGFGTWVAHAAGRVLVGVDSTQTEFDGLGETGGAKTHTLTEAQMPAHRHTIGHVNHGAGPGPANPNPTWVGYLHNSGYGDGSGLGDFVGTGDQSMPGSGPRGGGQAHNNLQPYITVYVWRRTA